MAEITRHGWATGTRVQVRNRFTHSWSSGFEVADDRSEGNVLVRRLSDNALLPIRFEPAEVRADA